METGNIGKKPSATLFLLARYYKQIVGLKKPDINKKLHNLMEQLYPGYIKANWEEVIDKAVQTSKKRPLINIDGIPVTQDELDIVDALPNIKLRRLAFTMICVAKYFNELRDTNNGWVNLAPKDIFILANVNASCRVQAELYAELTDAGIITYSNRAGSDNAKVQILSKSPGVLVVKDMRNLGYEYMKYKGEPYFHCKRCGILTKQNKQHNRKYCPDCAGWRPITHRRFECIDCGKEVYVVGRNTQSCRCAECQVIARKRRNEKPMEIQDLCDSST